MDIIKNSVFDMKFLKNGEGGSSHTEQGIKAKPWKRLCHSGPWNMQIELLFSTGRFIMLFILVLYKVILTQLVLFGSMITNLFLNLVPNNYVIIIVGS